jgi:hypothetical protein
MIHVAPLHAVDAFRPSDTVHLVELDDPEAFARIAPTPSPGSPHAGLPPNIWCGVVVDGRTSQNRAEELLAVRARVLWVYYKSGPWRRTVELYEHWRCPRCGRRGEAPRPKKCPHAGQICGGVRLEPQIQWLILDPAAVVDTSEVKELGGVVYPDDIPFVHSAELVEAVRRWKG